MVIMEWETADDWIRWMNSKEAKKLQWQVDRIIGEKTFFEVYKPEEFSKICIITVYRRFQCLVDASASYSNAIIDHNKMYER